MIAGLTATTGNALTDTGGVLRAARLCEHAELQRVLAPALPSGGRTRAGGLVRVNRQHSVVRLVLIVSPVNHEVTQPHPGPMSALVLLVDPPSHRDIDAGRVGAILGLTPAESQIAAMLTGGMTIRDIASASGRSVTTVKWHVQRVFAKLDVSRQADLVRLILSLPGVPGGLR